MSIFKCKICGGDLEISSDSSIAICQYCGTKQTLPHLSDERRANLYDRANHFRRNNDYDKAMGIYEQILSEDTTDAEAYWSIILCRYGIEYVKDGASNRYLPTVNRMQYTSIYDDEDYKSAIQNADTVQREIYEADAQDINNIQKEILSISQKEEPFDVFICYKETDANGRRTQDSVLATELYHELTKEGFKVFFSRITLEDKLGTAYEPYIFAALNSAKVMVVLGTKPEHFNAVWVKNEWSRYLALIKNGAKKMLIPAYRDMDPYDLPDEFSHLQAQDMSKLGFMQDLIRGIKKIIGADVPKSTVKETAVVSANNASTAPLLGRAFLFLEDGKWNDADIYCEKVLDIDPKNAEAYLGKLMVELQVKTRKQLADCAKPFDDRDNYGKVLRFGDESLENEMRGYIAHINDRNENTRLARIYDNAQSAMQSAQSEDAYKKAASIFNSISGFKDADTLAEQCLDKAESCRKNGIYDRACSLLNIDIDILDEDADYHYILEKLRKDIELFQSISGWKDSDKQIIACKKKIEKIKEKEETARLERERQAQIRAAEAEKARKRNKKIAMIATPIVCVFIAFLIVLEAVITTSKYNAAMNLYNAGNYTEAISAFKALDGYQDSATQIEKCNTAIKDEKYDAALALYNDKKYTEAVSAFEALAGYRDSTTQIEKCKMEIMKNANVGDTILFGSYEQDKNTSNGKEEIEWQVLAKEGTKILVISKYALDCKQYNTRSTGVTWETCSLRTWLNETFYDTAFGTTQKAMIQKTTVNADKNPDYSTNPGNATSDNVFLLSITEVNKYFSSDEARKCVPTAYAIAHGGYANSSYTVGGKATCSWWLRSPGLGQNSAAYVYADGSVNLGGQGVYSVFNEGVCVRPALWINVSEISFE